MLQSAFQLVALRRLPWSRFHYARWQAWLAIALIATLMGFDPGLRVELFGTQSVPAPAWGVAMAYSWVCSLASVWIGVGFLRWWMQRGGRWDGQGDLFNLLVAAELVMNMLLSGWAAASMPMAWTVPMALYALWVICNALSGAIPQASRAYSLGGLLLATMLQLCACVLVWAVTKMLLSVPGLVVLPGLT